MISNSKEFLVAVDYVQKLKTKPSNDELLYLYKYYKQASEGNNNRDKPGLLDFKGSEKWKAWDSVKGTSTYDSEVAYITYVNQLIKKYGIN
jgi:diazepam-binding inhibitor (GABA receptor modulating acyl-CoA-binding protein)